MNATRHKIYAIATLGGAMALAGCGTANTYVRAVNASPGLTNFTIQVGETGVASSFPYGTEGVQQPGQYSTTDASGNYRPIGAASNQQVIVYVQPGSPPLASATHSFLKNSFSTIVTLDAAPNIHLLTLTDDDRAPQSGDFKLRVVHASPSAGPVDIYLTAPGAGLGGATPIVSNLQFAQVTSTYLELSPGSYQVQITPHGNPSQVVISASISPTAGHIYSAFALDPPAGGAGKFGLLLTDDPVTTLGAAASGSTSM